MIFWTRFSICKFVFRIFYRFATRFFRPKPNLRVNALNLKGIEWLLKLSEDLTNSLKEVNEALRSCCLMEVDIDKNVEFKVSSRYKFPNKEDHGKEGFVPKNSLESEKEETIKDDTVVPIVEPKIEDRPSGSFSPSNINKEEPI